MDPVIPPQSLTIMPPVEASSSLRRRSAENRKRPDNASEADHKAIVFDPAAGPNMLTPADDVPEDDFADLMPHMANYHRGAIVNMLI